jgi:hypothetical protein
VLQVVVQLQDAVGYLLRHSGDAGAVRALSWPANAWATINFLRSLNTSQAGSRQDWLDSDCLHSRFIRKPGFLLIFTEGDVVLISEREAHCILEALHAMPKKEAQGVGLTHIAFARGDLPAHGQNSAAQMLIAGQLKGNVESHRQSVSKQGSKRQTSKGTHNEEQLRWNKLVATALVAVQVFGGETLYQRLPHSDAAQDHARMNLLASTLLKVSDASRGEGGPQQQHEAWRRDKEKRAAELAVLAVLQARGRKRVYKGSCLEQACAHAVLGNTVVYARQSLSKW